MRMTKKKYSHIEQIICKQFSTFGGGYEDKQNIVAIQNGPAIFALGVDVGKVVRVVLLEYLKLQNKEQKARK